MSGRSQFVRRLACATLTGVALAALSWHPALSARATKSPETLPDHRLFGDWSTEGGSGVIAVPAWSATRLGAGDLGVTPGQPGHCVPSGVTCPPRSPASTWFTGWLDQKHVRPRGVTPHRYAAR